MNNQSQILDLKASHLSDRYRLVKTSDLITKIESMGFKLDDFIVNTVRKQEKHGFQKHRALFSSDALTTSHNADGKVQIMLTNAHNGTSSVDLRLGFFRFVCSNGLVVGDLISQPIKLRHTGQMLYDNIDKAVEQIAAQAHLIDGNIDQMKSTQLGYMDVLELQKQSLGLRLGEKMDNIINFTFPVRRDADRDKDLFTVFNVIQESLINGGVKYTIKGDDGSTKLKTLKKINSINSQTEINNALWNSVMKVAA